jgi:hypothetical protein
MTCSNVGVNEASFESMCRRCRFIRQVTFYGKGGYGMLTLMGGIRRSYEEA